MDDSRNTSSSSEVLLQPNEVEIPLEEEEGEPIRATVLRFLRSVWERRRIALPIMAVGVLLSLLAAILDPNIYTSSTSLMPPGNTSSFGSVMSMLSSSSGAGGGLTDEMLGMSTPGELFVAILKSRNVQDALVTRFGLMGYYGVNTKLDARGSLESSTNITQDDKSGTITIEVSATSAQLAAQLAQGYVTELNRVVTDDSTSSARRERVFLEGRVSDVKRDLDDSSKALSQFSTKNKAIDIPSQARSMMDAGLRLQTELIDGRSQLAGLKETYSEDNPRVKAAEARNDELQREMDAMGGSPHAHGDATDNSSSPYPTASQLPGLGLTYYDLQRKVRVDETVWETLTKEYEIAKVEEAKQIPTVRVLDEANVPERKSGPKRKLILMIGTVLSFAFTCLIVFLINYWEKMDPASPPKRMMVELTGRVFRRRRKQQAGVEVH